MACIGAWWLGGRAGAVPLGTDYLRSRCSYIVFFFFRFGVWKVGGVLEGQCEGGVHQHYRGGQSAVKSIGGECSLVQVHRY